MAKHGEGLLKALAKRPHPHCEIMELWECAIMELWDLEPQTIS